MVNYNRSVVGCLLLYCISVGGGDTLQKRVENWYGSWS